MNWGKLEGVLVWTNQAGEAGRAKQTGETGQAKQAGEVSWLSEQVKQARLIR